MLIISPRQKTATPLITEASSGKLRRAIKPPKIAALSGSLHLASGPESKILTPHAQASPPNRKDAACRQADCRPARRFFDPEPGFRPWASCRSGLCKTRSGTSRPAALNRARHSTVETQIQGNRTSMITMFRLAAWPVPRRFRPCRPLSPCPQNLRKVSKIRATVLFRGFTRTLDFDPRPVPYRLSSSGKILYKFPLSGVYQVNE